jgi:hypothetical protein
VSRKKKAIFLLLSYCPKLFSRPSLLLRVLLFLPLGKKGKFLLGKGEVGRFSQIQFPV